LVIAKQLSRQNQLTNESQTSILSKVHGD